MKDSLRKYMFISAFKSEMTNCFRLLNGRMGLQNVLLILVVVVCSSSLFFRISLMY